MLYEAKDVSKHKETTKELIGIQLVIALAMISFAYLLEFSTGDLLFIMGVVQILSAYVTGYFWNRSAKKPKYNISIKDGTIG